MSYDAVVIGSGPNGLAAAIRLAWEGRSVKVFEQADTIGGGTRTMELTLPGFHHDVCSAIHPMAISSPFLKALPLEEYGLEWIHPEVPVAHPLEDQPAAALFHSLEKTEAYLGKDGETYHDLITPFVDSWEKLANQILAPFTLLPSHPLLLARFGLLALLPAENLANKFEGAQSRALFAGLAAHSLMSFNAISSSAIGLVMAIAAHTEGWPLPKGGSHAITKAMARYLESLGGEIETGVEITGLEELPPSDTILFNTTPRQILDIAGGRLPGSYAKKLRKFKYGPGVFKVDLALSDPIPWKDPVCAKAGTVHLGGTFEEVAASEHAAAKGRLSENPYVLVAQQSLFDDTRAPEGKHTAWAYCHVPNGSDKDRTKTILDQIERFAPGLRDCIIGQHTMNSGDMQAYNPNYIGGDINGGKQSITQLFTRPADLFNPYHIPETNMYICSSSTPPGGGVHGMCGYHAAESVLKGS